MFQNGRDQVVFNITHGCVSMEMMPVGKFRFAVSRTGLTSSVGGVVILSRHAAGWSTGLLIHRRAQTHGSTGGTPPPPPYPVFLSSMVSVYVTDLISHTICWLEAQHRWSYPPWQIQTAYVYSCFSQGLAQYGRVDSPSWPPSLHPLLYFTPKDLDIFRKVAVFSLSQDHTDCTCTVLLIYQTKTHEIELSTNINTFSSLGERSSR